jgi:hypothetical protein
MGFEPGVKKADLLDALAESSPTPEPAEVARREVAGDHVDIRRLRAN